MYFTEEQGILKTNRSTYMYKFTNPVIFKSTLELQAQPLGSCCSILVPPLAILY